MYPRSVLFRHASRGLLHIMGFGLFSHFTSVSYSLSYFMFSTWYAQFDVYLVMVVLFECG